MGGDYYDRPVEVASNNQGYSDQAAKVLTQSSLHKSNDPRRFAEEERSLLSKHKHPIVFALDVSGSMGDWPKIIYDKLPMFYGQIMMQGYLSDPEVSFCAVDDTMDQAPLQITDFGQGVQIDQLISKVYLESGGSGEESRHEAYELSALFYARHCELLNPELPFFFITGDEYFYKKLKGKHVEKILGYKPKEQNEDSIHVWKELTKKFNVFHLHKPYDSKISKGELKPWEEALGKERILEMKTPKACIDVILGAIALVSGSRTLEGYVKDMEVRGQDKARIEEVLHSLRHLTPEFLKSRTLRFKPKEEEKTKVEEKKPEEEKKEEFDG